MIGVSHMKEGFGLVLAGGGTKGAYEVGAWKALKELNKIGRAHV